MRFFRKGGPGKETPFVTLSDGTTVGIQQLVSDLVPETIASLDFSWLESLPIPENTASGSDDMRFGSPLHRPGKIVCIGLNYKDHAEETGGSVPEEPIIFMKSPSALAGPNDALVLPRGSEQTDWEVELAIVIGRKARYVSEEEALEYVFGYSIMVDYSEREYQKKRRGQWTKGKSCDGFGPLGPVIVTPDEIGDVQNLSLWLKVNGEVKQESNTSRMIYSVAFLISYLSEFMSLMPGDIISTGTPAGVGLGHKPPQFLRAGDIVECGIEGIGEMRQEVLGEDPDVRG